jgi:hypothetical protein
VTGAPTSLMSVSVNDAPPLDSMTASDLKVNDNGTALLEVDGLGLHRLLNGLPPRCKITLGFPNCADAPLSVYCARFGN